MARLRIGFLMDPLEGVRVDHDTTFALMLEAQRRGHEVRAFEQRDLSFRDDHCQARMRTVAVRRDQAAHFEVLAQGVAPLGELDVVFLRKDPPVDQEYLHATQLVELCGRGRSPALINRPAGLRSANEKLYALRFPDLCPRSLVDGDPLRLRAFIDEVGEAVLKPVDGFGGLGVVVVRRGDRNNPALIELMTAHGTRHVVAQQFLAAATAGDKRVLVLDGEPIGAVLRVAGREDHRNNMAAGGTAVAAEVEARDEEICARLKPHLLADGLHFVGIDVIGGALTEVNVTSPTGIVEAERFCGENLCARVLSRAEELAQGRPLAG